MHVASNPEQRPLTNLPISMSFVLDAQYMSSHPTVNGTLDIEWVVFLPNCSLKYIPKIDPIAMGSTAKEAENSNNFKIVLNGKRSFLNYLF